MHWPHTTIEDVQSWLLQLQVLEDSKQCHAPKYLRPYHLASAALLLKECGAQKLEVADGLSEYANKMRLWDAIGLRSPLAQFVETGEIPKYLPIEALVSRDAVDDCSNRLALIGNQANLDDESRRSLGIATSELLDNCFAHAGPADGLHGLACAQTWKGSQLAQIAIADRGMGIRASLEAAETEEVRSRAASSNVCDLATELGVTSKPSNGHAGYGLALTRQLLERNGGTLVVVSGKEWFIASAGATQSGTDGVNWPGTLIVFELNTAKPLSSRAVYDSWPPVRGYSDDDFDFPD